MSAKEEMMGRIRRALSDGPDRRGDQTPALDRSQPPGSADEGLAAQFRSEMEKLGGRVVEAPSEEEVNSYIDGLLKQANRVAVSDLVSARWPGVCVRLREKGIEIVPSLVEFARAPVDQRSKMATQAETAQDSLFADGPDERTAGTETRGSAAEASGSPAEGDRPESSLMERYKLSLFDTAVGITTADYAIADTGTLVLLSKKVVDSPKTSRPPDESAPPESGPKADGEQHRLISLVPPVHVCLLDRKRIVANLTELLTLVHNDFYLTGGPPLAMTFISGPSRTADIELTLTKGVHGPREVHVLLWG